MPSPNPSMPSEGKKSPAFNLPSQSGDKIRLSSLKGAPVVLYFYPKDNTPGCTVEAKEFRDSLRDFKRAGAEVIGISPDSVDSHCKFIDKQGLNFTLLADTEHFQVCSTVVLKKAYKQRVFYPTSSRRDSLSPLETDRVRSIRVRIGYARMLRPPHRTIPNAAR